MRLYAAITGDIVNSSDLGFKKKAGEREAKSALDKEGEKGEREKLLDYLKQIFRQIEEKWGTDLEQEFVLFRGDSFQGLLNNPASALEIALFIRLKLLENQERTYPERWDARIAIGIGEVSFKGKEIGTSEGPAFRNSGPFLDKMKGKERIKIIATDGEFNGEMKVATAFLDAITESWTDKQASSLLKAMDGKKQKEIAKELGIKNPSGVSYFLSRAKWKTVEEFIKRYKYLAKKNFVD